MALQFSEDRDALKTRLKNLVGAHIGRNNIHEIALSISTGSNSTAIHVSNTIESGVSSESQVITSDTPYFVASTSKLFATAIILQLVDEGELSIEDSMHQFFPVGTLDGLHIIKDVDRTANITIKQLLAHTSGLADYFEGKMSDGSQLSKKLMNNHDSAWSVSDVVNTVKDNLTPEFAPGSPKKAHYSDTNYQLLGAIIENVTKKSLFENIDVRISKPLGMQNTYLFTKESTESRLPVLPMRFKENTVSIPMAMTSVRLDGGIVSTSADSLNFIQAFMQGQLFKPHHLSEIQQWNSIGFPLQAGVGIIKFSLPGIFSLVGRSKDLIGHSGISGAFAFYNPASNIYLAGTINQLNNPSLPFKFMLKVINAAKTN